MQHENIMKYALSLTHTYKTILDGMLIAILHTPLIIYKRRESKKHLLPTIVYYIHERINIIGINNLLNNVRGFQHSSSIYHN